MVERATRAAGRSGSVATPPAGPVDSPAGCLHCGRPIPKPRPRQKACSSRCRWALWKRERHAAARAQASRDDELRAALTEIRELVQASLRRLT
jgi:predicted nucleic acid-binding Zn ribbon protein